MAKLSEYWKRFSPEWRFALAAFLVARISLSVWSFVVFSNFPVSLQNVDLFGDPVLTIFDLQTGERSIYSRQVDGNVLSFHLLDREHMIDDLTGSIWVIQNGKGIQGSYGGKSLTPSSHSTEEIFPYEGMLPAKNVALALWQRFDTNWYLKIATHGYNGSDGSTVYFPMYPLLIRIFVFIFHPMFAAMLVSNLALIGVLVLLYRLVSNLADESIARRTLVYFLIFPTAFFLTSAYTESLFLLFALGSLFSASQRKWDWSVIWGVFAALTRLQGVLLVVPLGYMIWREVGFASLKKLVVRAWPLTFIPMATLTFLGFSRLSLLNTYQGMLHAKFVLPWKNIWATISLLLNGNGTIVDALNLTVTLGLAVMLFVVWKKLPFEYTLYSVLMLIAPMLRMTTTQPLVSMSRYALAVFPIFVILGGWGKRPWVNWVILYSSVFLQLYLSAQFILWGWVA